MIIIENVRCEYLLNPIGIDVEEPRITWNLSTDYFDSEDIYQKNFQIYYSINRGDDTLDKTSGVIESRSMNYIFKNEFKSRDLIRYQIEITDNYNRKFRSGINTFEYGILDKKLFKAKWIRGDYRTNYFKNKRFSADFFCKTFTLSINDLKRIKKARAYISALGLYEASLNYKKIGDFVLAPGSTDYRKRIQYQTYDVLSHLTVGLNRIELILSDGWFRGNNGGSGKPNTFGRTTRAFFQLDLLDEANNVFKSIISNRSRCWSNDGPIIFADIKDGETINNNLIPSFNQKAKETNIFKNKFFSNRLNSSNNFYLKEKEVYEPIREIISPKKKHILEFENNLAGYIYFKVKAKKGDKIRLVLGEYIDNEGEFSLLNIQDHTKYGDTPKQEINFICKEGINEYKSKFFYGGFKYCQIETTIKNYNISDFKQIAIYNDFELTSCFKCSNKLLNIFYKNTLNSFKSNSVDVPTDCPTRERAGRTGDSQLFFNTAAYLANYAPFAKKHINDLIDRQYRDGRFTCIAPKVNEPLFILPTNGSVGWADAGILIPYYLYKRYYDVEYLKRIYKPMCKYINFMIRRIGKRNFPLNKKIDLSYKDKKYLVRKGQSYGEWLEPDEINPFDWRDIAYPHPETSTAYTHYVLKCFKEIEDVLGHKKESQKLDKYIDGTKRAYQKLVETKDFSLNTFRQALLVRPLYFGLLNKEQKEFAQKQLIKDLNEFNWKVGTGFLSTPFILYVLFEIDPKYAFKLLENENCPGWLFMAKNNTSSLWESWEGVKKDYGVSSLNHYSKGAMMQFVFEKILGINVVSENCFKITPYLGGSLTFANGFYDSIYGKVMVDLKLNENKSKIKISLDLPVNTSALFIYKNFKKHLKSGHFEFIFDNN